MGTFKNNRQIKQSWPLWRLILTGLNAFALVLSLIMSWHYLSGGQMIGCGGGSPCEQVLGSRWSIIAGIFPISGLAVGVYLALLVAGFFIGPTTELPIRRMAWKVMLILTGAIAGSAIWFTILQKWVIGNFCPYCMTTHISGLLLTVLVIWRAIKELGNNSNDVQKKISSKGSNTLQCTGKHRISPLSVLGFSLIGLALAGLMATIQVAFTPSSVYKGGESQNRITGIDYHNVPIVGSPDAPYIVTLLFDYQCSHCQKLHFMLDEAVRRYSGKLAFVIGPVPLNSQCNPYVPTGVEAFKNSCELAKTGMAVWLAKHDAFPSFEAWMFSFESGDSWRPRNLDTATAKAIELVGKANFDAAWNNPWIDSYMQSCMKIYGQTIQNGKGGVPKLLFNSRWVIPEAYSEDDLLMILQKDLGVPKP